MKIDELTVTAYLTEDDYCNHRLEQFFTTSEEAANAFHQEYESKGYYLVTTTNQDGKLVR
ncbi:hypothetical protein [Vibrio parahaemolyticus]|uniref:hypothetical protein n=1 Tax=Vibrio parahaemolyticus TaxID=670 RepID=UPI00081348D6|nr:hypothetical protein [Vibrio parahaemolyticus]OCP68226.1 hypothetical protein AKH08_15525 [Vibrio parahaemolyticus]